MSQAQENFMTENYCSGKRSQSHHGWLSKNHKLCKNHRLKVQQMQNKQTHTHTNKTLDIIMSFEKGQKMSYCPYKTVHTTDLCIKDIMELTKVKR